MKIWGWKRWNKNTEVFCGTNNGIAVMCRGKRLFQRFGVYLHQDTMQRRQIIWNCALNCPHNEIKLKQFQNSFETVLFQFYVVVFFQFYGECVLRSCRLCELTVNDDEYRWNVRPSFMNETLMRQHTITAVDAVMSARTFVAAHRTRYVQQTVFWKSLE